MQADENNSLKSATLYWLSTSWAAGLAEAGEHYSSNEPELEESYNHPPDMACALQKLGAGKTYQFFPW